MFLKSRERNFYLGRENFLSIYVLIVQCGEANLRNGVRRSLYRRRGKKSLLNKTAL